MAVSTVQAPERRRVLRILVVDSSLEDVRSVCDLLRRNGEFLPHAARSVEEAQPLLDEGVYLASVSTMYRILREENLTGERRRGHRRKGHATPQVSADGPCQVWSWDISRLCGPGPRDWFYLYVILDIFSRKIVGWCVDTEETETVAKRLITITCERENIEADQLTLHSDRGAQMTSTTIAELLEDLSVTRSLSRPRVSDDNPYSEAAFKTVKYRPSYPDWFDSIEDARVWMRKFVGWSRYAGDPPALRAARSGWMTWPSRRAWSAPLRAMAVT